MFIVHAARRQDPGGGPHGPRCQGQNPMVHTAGGAGSHGSHCRGLPNGQDPGEDPMVHAARGRDPGGDPMVHTARGRILWRPSVREESRCQVGVQVSQASTCPGV